MNPANAKVFTAAKLIDDGDMLLRRALPREGIEAIGPFVFVDHYRHVSRRGIGDRPHPHAGIEVISYLLEGEVHHRDSMGFSDVIRAGDVQVICAGRGMIHMEKPAGGRHGLQMWTSLPSAMKRAAPSYKRFASSELPVCRDEAGSVRVICGHVNGEEGPLQLARKTLLAHASMHAGQSRTVSLDADQEAAVYVLAGVAVVDGAALAPGDGRRVDASVPLLVRARTACDVVIFGGARVEESIHFSGPFVMDTQEGLRQAHLDFLGGRMGALDGVPH